MGYSKTLDLKRYREVEKNLDDKELYKLSEDTKMEKTTMVCVCVIFLSTIIISGIIIICGIVLTH